MNIIDRIKDIIKVSPKKGDILLFKEPKGFSMKDVDDTYSAIDRMLKENHFECSFILLPYDMDVTLLSREKLSELMDGDKNG